MPLLLPALAHQPDGKMRQDRRRHAAGGDRRRLLDVPVGEDEKMITKDDGKKCPYCGEIDSKVIDSRPTEDGEKIRRRRECLNCKKRFTTYEIVETVPLMVVKKDHSREVFDRQKLLNGMLRACEKRPVSYQQLDDAVSRIEQMLLNSYDREVTSIHIGDLAMQELKKMDDVAYVRFASVYRQFSDVNTFMEELKDMLDTRSKPAEK